MPVTGDQRNFVNDATLLWEQGISSASCPVMNRPQPCRTATTACVHAILGLQLWNFCQKHLLSLFRRQFYTIKGAHLTIRKFTKRHTFVGSNFFFQNGIKFENNTNDNGMYNGIFNRLAKLNHVFFWLSSVKHECTGDTTHALSFGVGIVLFNKTSCTGTCDTWTREEIVKVWAKYSRKNTVWFGRLVQTVALKIINSQEDDPPTDNKKLKSLWLLRLLSRK